MVVLLNIIFRLISCRSKDVLNLRWLPLLLAALCILYNALQKLVPSSLTWLVPQSQGCTAFRSLFVRLDICLESWMPKHHPVSGSLAFVRSRCWESETLSCILSWHTHRIYCDFLRYFVLADEKFEQLPVDLFATTNFKHLLGTVVAIDVTESYFLECFTRQTCTASEIKN